MRLLKLALFVFTLLNVSKHYAQSNLCNGALPFCTGSAYNFPSPNGSSAPSGANYGCIGSARNNPNWYYLKVGTPGAIVLNISGTNGGDDIDFACWGPFTGPTSGCTAQLTSACGTNCTSNTYVSLFPPFTPAPTVYPSGNLIDCSYDIQNAEVCTIGNALAGQYYMILITRASAAATNIIFNQTNVGAPGAGATDCSIVTPSCSISAVTANASVCNIANNTYSLTGTITFTDAPTTGSLVVTNSCGTTQNFVAPFVSPITYTFTGLTSNGNNCTINTAFSAAASCTKTVSYSAPASCTALVCLINSITSNPSACDVSTNMYSLTGSVTFTNAPSTGSLVVTNSCGTSQSFTAPFISPVNYTFTSLTSNGNNCIVGAVFSGAPSCTNTVNYSAPPSCTTTAICLINTITINPSVCDVATNTYSITGSVTFTNAPSTGSLIVTNSCGTSQSFAAPFVSPVNYTFSGLISNGLACNINASFSSASSCTLTNNYNAPLACVSPTVCLINAIVADASACNLSNNTYSVTGSITFTNEPIIGTLLLTNSCGTSQTFTAPFTNPTTYTFTNISSDGGNCNISASFSAFSNCINVKAYSAPVLCSYNCFENKNYDVPNAFSPNGDTNNDAFCLQGWKGCIVDFYITIFNRWGEKIYESTDANFCWDGTYKGILLEPAVFMYYIKAEGIKQGAINKKGNITLIR